MESNFTHGHCTGVVPRLGGQFKCGQLRRLLFSIRPYMADDVLEFRAPFSLGCRFNWVTFMHGHFTVPRLGSQFK
jgi:hypothetical protein